MTRADAPRTEAGLAGAIPDAVLQANQRLRGVLASRFADPGVERAYRAYFLEPDKRHAALAIGVYALLKSAYAAVDVMVQPADALASVLVIRFAFVVACALAMLLVLRVRSHVQYDALVFGWAALVVASSFYTLTRRPPESFGFALVSPMTVLLFFAFFRNRIGLQLLAACLLIGADAFIVAAMRVQVGTPVLTQLALTYAIALLVGVTVSRQLKHARRKVFSALLNERDAAEAMRELAFRDDLTGVLNRRSFMHLGAAGWHRRTQAEGGCVMILDLDHFKALNDRYGHEAGDQALVRFARMVETVKREEDLFGRIGGEEFALLLPGVARARAEEIADEIVGGCRTLRGTEGESVSVSIGLAQIAPGDATLGACMLRADRALYRAKADGRGRRRSAGESDDRQQALPAG
jgi:diguanylate cyclase (GGDEF)-like protein